MHSIKLHTIFVILCLILPASLVQSAKSNIAVEVDNRVELFSLIFRLGGNPEYNSCVIPSYLVDVDACFGKHADHRAVAMAAQLRREFGISYNSVMDLAVHVTPLPFLRERISLGPVPASMDKRWISADIREFLELARAFAVETDFQSFYSDHGELYSLTRDRLNDLLERENIPRWCTTYFGTQPGSHFYIELALLNGRNNYGSNITLTGAPTEMHCILGVDSVDSNGLPEFSDNALYTIVHEYCHSFINPAVESVENSFEPAARVLYSVVAEQMESQAYGDWRIMINESLVRAATIRWAATTADSALVPDFVEFQQKLGFHWMPELNDLLAEYERSRDDYPAFALFLPSVATFLSSYSATFEARMAAEDSLRNAEIALRKMKAPRVTGMNPANGARDVDPELSVIVFTFDRPMMDKHWSFIDLGNEMPKITGTPAFNTYGDSLTLPISLQPGMTYQFALNKPYGGGFRDTKSNQLFQYIVRFSTREY